YSNYVLQVTLQRRLKWLTNNTRPSNKKWKRAWRKSLKQAPSSTKIVVSSVASVTEPAQPSFTSIWPTLGPAQVTPSPARTWIPSSLLAKTSSPQHAPKVSQSFSLPLPTMFLTTTSHPIWAYGARRSPWKLLMPPPVLQISTHESHH